MQDFETYEGLRQCSSSAKAGHQRSFKLPSPLQAVQLASFPDRYLILKQVQKIVATFQPLLMLGTLMSNIKLARLSRETITRKSFIQNIDITASFAHFREAQNQLTRLQRKFYIILGFVVGHVSVIFDINKYLLTSFYYTTQLRGWQ